jgi:hypothetical protein
MMLLVSPCAQLKSLSTLLREKYDERNKIIARGCADTSLFKAEIEIIRVQKVITRHRRLCPHCKLNKNSTVGADARLKPFASERSAVPHQTY